MASEPDVRAALAGGALRPEWKIHTGRLLAEVLENPECWVLKNPLIIFDNLLRRVASRASELNDPELNQLMALLTLYEIADPFSPGYDAEATRKLIEE